MARPTRHTIRDVVSVCGKPNPPQTLGDIAHALGYSRIGSLTKLLREPTQEAPEGYEVVFFPRVLRKQSEVSSKLSIQALSRPNHPAGF